MKASRESELKTNKIQMKKLDEFVKQNEIPCVDLIKIDTETTEPDILRGAMDILKRDEPIIFCEVLKGYAREREVGEIMRSYGYEFYLLTSEGPVKKEFIEGHSDWLNYLFAKSRHDLPII